MKKTIIFSLYLLTAVVAFNSCRKSDNPRIPDLTRFPVPSVTKVTGTDQVISALNPGAFNAKYTVGLYFPNDVPPQKMDVVVIKNGNTSVVKSLQPNVTTFPTTLQVTGTQLATLFGSPIVLNDRFDIGVDITTADGTKYEAFPANGAAFASGIAAQPNASTFVRYQAVCKYDPSIYNGAFVVVSDEWGDYQAGDNITLTKIDDTHFSFKYLATNPLPISVTVDPNTNIATVPKQKYGSSYPDPNPWPYGDLYCESVSSPDNVVAPCDGVFSVVLQHSTPLVSFSGTYKIVLKKQ